MAQRHALLVSLSRALILNERIKTTEGRAKELRPFIEKMITNARNGTQATHRIIEKKMPTDATEKLMKEIGPRYKSRPGGYTRILKLGPREKDGVKMVIIEFV